MAGKINYTDVIYPVQADLHNHIQTGGRIKDGCFDKVIAALCRKSIGMIGVINFDDDRYEQLVNCKGSGRNDRGFYVRLYGGLTLIKGQEIPTKQGHLLALGLKKNVHLKSGKTLEDTIAEAKDENAVIIADHPMYFEGCGDYLMKNPKLLKKIDAIEVYNATTSLGIPGTPLKSGTNKKAQEWFNSIKDEYPNLGCISSSDGHSLYEIGRNYITIDEKVKEHLLVKGIEPLREAIRGHRDFSNDKQGKIAGKIGAIEHYIKLAYYHGADKIIKRLEEKN